jgi:hypothetical protein
MTLTLPAGAARRIREALDDGFTASEDIASLAEMKALEYMVAAEKKYIAVIKGLDPSDKAAVAKAEADLYRVKAEIDNMLLGRSEAWAHTYFGMSYAQGVNTIVTTLEAMAAVDYNVKELLLAFDAMEWSEAGQSMLAGQYSMAQDAFTTWNQETANWINETIAGGVDDKVAPGTFADIGKDKDTLMNRLLGSDSRLKGYEITTEDGRVIHRSAEQTAQAMSRVEVSKVENQAAAIEASSIGLDYCFNANPMDLNTTDPCREATDAGVIPVEEMIEKYGLPPRLDEQFHLCRSKVIYCKKEWMEGRE